jgi:hypothetical protein
VHVPFKVKPLRLTAEEMKENFPNISTNPHNIIAGSGYAPLVMQHHTRKARWVSNNRRGAGRDQHCTDRLQGGEQCLLGILWQGAWLPSVLCAADIFVVNEVFGGVHPCVYGLEQLWRASRPCFHHAFKAEVS